MRRNGKWGTASAGIIGAILILDGRTALLGAQEGITLCIRSVIPSLFPFLVLSAYLTGALYSQQIPFLCTLGGLLHIPTGTEGILIPAFLGGYPLGAQAIGQAFQENRISDSSACRLLCFCNNVGPAFLFGMLSGLLGSVSYSWLCWGVQMACAFTAASLLKYDSEYAPGTPPASAVSLTDAVRKAMLAMGQICSWVILFRVVIAFCDRWFLWVLPEYVRILFCGLLELTNGCCMLPQIESPLLRFVMANCMLSFGGICVAMQTASVAAGLPIKSYLLWKCIQSVLAAVYALIVFAKPILLIPILGIVYCISRKQQENNGSIPAIPVV